MNKPIEEYDDGTQVYLDSYSGGASKDGGWAHLTLLFASPRTAGLRREYHADDVVRRWLRNEALLHDVIGVVLGVVASVAVWLVLKR